ncbi:MAG: hypothetical protein ACLSB9_34035 [Hydrogeniiclostridium mannosilyticum]
MAILLVFALAVSTSYYLFLWPGRTVETMAHPGRFGTETVVIDAGHMARTEERSQGWERESYVNLAIATLPGPYFGRLGLMSWMLRKTSLSR